MKNRIWLCYVLDVFGTTALLGAGIALAAALWFTAAGAEGVLLVAFKNCLIAAVGSFVLARICELTRLVRLNEMPGTGEAPLDGEAADNVKPLPTPKQLPRAA